MKTYTFGDVTKTLKKNTFAIEKEVMAVVGATDETEARLLAIQAEYAKLSKELSAKPTKKRAEAINARLAVINDEVVKLSKKLSWYDNFDMCMKVADVLLVEGSAKLTPETFGRFDAQEMWEDFFTAPRKRSED